MTDMGTVRVMRINATGVGFRAPESWCSFNGLTLGSPVFVRGNLDGSISFFGVRQEWGKEIKLRVKDRRYAILTIPNDIARTRGIVQSDVVSMEADPETGELRLRKETA